MCPYSNSSPATWNNITKSLIEAHPLKSDVLVSAVLSAWQSIFRSSIGEGLIGRDIFPQPQIMGYLLHELVPLELQSRYPGIWQRDVTSADKDIVYIPDPRFSIEVKTSSDPRHIFGNRSYAQETTNGKKAKTGYYLAINFQKFDATPSTPQIVRIRFGWLDATDWIGQKAATGQQSRLPKEIYEGKLLTIYQM
ncbi:MAG: ScaI family restriction endonuclease [Desulfovibrio sp.]|jgi:hypothetical protein|nr:ScaI family restriction endonuclease [Desulfovibrio sp.]